MGIKHRAALALALIALISKVVRDETNSMTALE
jgi:hypothetical protein